MPRIFWVCSLVQGVVNHCRHHLKILVSFVILVLLAVQFILFNQNRNYFPLNVSSWSFNNSVAAKLDTILLMHGTTGNLSNATQAWDKLSLANRSTAMRVMTPLLGNVTNMTALDATDANDTSVLNMASFKNVSTNETSKTTGLERNVKNIESKLATTTSTPATNLSLCPLIPPKLVGPVKVWTDAPSFEELEKLYPELELGGRFRPKECIARHKVAIIIPYRDREEHLRIFLHNIHPILQRQQLDYAIYVIEQKPKTKFNRAKLMNVGYVESLKQYDYQCFIFHDVDLLPEDDRNLYSCPEQPRHMSAAIDVFKYKLPYDRIFGGVSALNKSHMEKINGFSNQFWGWGGEDDDMANRIIHFGYHISRYPLNIARYKMLKHKKDEPNPERYKMLYKGKHRYGTDGIRSLRYQRLDILLKRLYTWVYVDLLEKR